MARSYKKVRPKKHRVYSVKDVERLFGVSANTVSNWVQVGLTPSDQERPYLFRGAELIRFHDERRKRSRKDLRAGEAYCPRCKCAVLPILETVKIDRPENRPPFMSGSCSDCRVVLFKPCTEADIAVFEGKANPNTSKGPSYEESAPAPAGIGVSGKIESDPKGTINDRIIYSWLAYAGRYDVKTMDQHLLAIRYMEDLLGCEPFVRLSTSDIARVREDLKRRVTAAPEEAWSKSTAKHRASHIKAFLEWLLRQEGYKRLPADLADYMDLPKSFFEKALPQMSKAYPTIQQAAEMLTAMPVSTPLDRRDRAMVAIAFLGALRADTVASLRIEHIDIAAKHIIQDATVSRTKNGKSLVIFWFPIPSCISEIVTEWVAALYDQGFGPQDALFPPVSWLDGTEQPGAQRCLPMKSTHAVTSAFHKASQYAPETYTPHAAKHTIAALRDELPLTQLQRKAWAANMGHDNETTTERHYGKMSDDDRLRALEEIGNPAEPIDMGLSNEEMQTFLGLLARVSAHVK